MVVDACTVLFSYQKRMRGGMEEAGGGTTGVWLKEEILAIIEKGHI